VIADTYRERERCRCTEIGLVPGLPVNQLRDLGSGCTDSRKGVGGNDKGVCMRLDRLRRRYGR
jgi:hypothetical protein